MLHVFRNAAKTWVVKLLFALLAFSFVAWGVGDFVRTNAFGKGAAISVGGVDVSAAEVDMEFKREIERLQASFKGHLTEEMARKIGYLDQTINTIKTRLLVDKAASDLGLAASDNTVIKALTEDPSLKNEQGQVDRERLRTALARMGVSEKAFLKIARAEQARNQLALTLTSGVVAPMTLVDPLLRRRYEQRVAEAVIVTDTAVPPAAAPTEAEIESYYKDNTSKFMAPEYRALTVLRLRPQDVAGEIKVTDEDLDKAYEQHQAEYNIPEKRQASQILITEQDKADKAAEMIKQGRDIIAIAQSLDSKPIDLGIVTKAELPTELQEGTFSAQSGTTVGPIKSDLGWHVIKVYSVTPAITKTLDQVKAQLTETVHHDKTIDLLADLSNKVDDALGGGASIEEAARRFNLTVSTYDAVDAKGLGLNGKAIADLPKDPAFLTTATHTDQGSESQMTENGQDGYFLVRVDGITPPAPRALAMVKTEVIAAVAATKRHQNAMVKADEIMAQLKTVPLSGIAKATGIEIKTTQPFTRDAGDASGIPAPAVSKIFEAAVGDVSKTELGNAWVVARLAQIIPTDPTAKPDEVLTVRRSLTQALSSDLSDLVLSALEAKIGVKIDRAQITHEE